MMSYFSSSRTYSWPNFCLCSQTSQCGYNVAVLSPEHEAAPQGPSFESYQHCPPSQALPGWMGNRSTALLTPCLHIRGRQRCPADAVQPLILLHSVFMLVCTWPSQSCRYHRKELTNFSHICSTLRRPMWNVPNVKSNGSYAERMQCFQE